LIRTSKSPKQEVTTSPITSARSFTTPKMPLQNNETPELSEDIEVSQPILKNKESGGRNKLQRNQSEKYVCSLGSTEVNILKDARKEVEKKPKSFYAAKESLKDEQMDKITCHDDIQSIIKKFVYENEISAHSGKSWHNAISEDCSTNLATKNQEKRTLQSILIEKPKKGDMSESNQQPIPHEEELHCMESLPGGTKRDFRIDDIKAKEGDIHLHEKEIPRKDYSPKTEKQASVDLQPVFGSKTAFPTQALMPKLSLCARIDGSKHVPKLSEEQLFVTPTTEPMEL
jgi:hypothetical protein